MSFEDKIQQISEKEFTQLAREGKFKETTNLALFPAWLNLNLLTEDEIQEFPKEIRSAETIYQLDGLKDWSIFNSHNFSLITTLSLVDLRLDTIGIDYLAQLENLTSLVLAGKQIGDAGSQHLAKLTNLDSLLLYNNRIGDTGAKYLAQLENLTSLHLNNNQIGEAGAQYLAHLQNLQILDLGHNEIGEAGAKHLAQLTNLNSLNLAHNQIGDAGAQYLAHLQNLQILDLGHNEIGNAGAQHLAQLTNLNSLDLRYNQIGEAGAQYLAHLQNLQILDLGHNEIGNAGAQHLAKLKNLVSLDLYKNKIGETGAKHLAQLTNLNSLNLAHNQIGEAGAEHLAQLKNLNSLNLTYNRIGEAGAEHLAKLKNLISLDLGSNQIDDAGAEHLAQLENLTSLHLNSNQIGVAGAEHLAKLANLHSLNLAYNQIGEAGAEHLAQLKNLNSLNLTYNRIGEAGAEHLAKLKNLISLDLGSNQIDDAGAEHLAQLENLTSLTLVNNRIGKTGTQHLGQLKNLISLDLGSNQIDDAGAEHLAQLKNLISLNLSNNQIDDAGAEHLAQLKNLISLNLRNNQIGDVGMKSLSNLNQLAELNLVDNKISDLTPLRSIIEKGIPVEWDEYGMGILVVNCPLKHPPPEVVQSGHDAVLNYFREIDAQGKDQLYEAKVLLVGEGRSGKTSLMRRLYYPDLPLPEEDETTKGIHIHPQEFPMANGRNFRLNVWDFGGQQIYHATHQFFLTKRSLYILLDDTAKDDKTIHDPVFKYWLGVVELLGEKSPLLIFQNEKGDRSKDIDISGIKNRFPNVKEVYHGNLKYKKSVEELNQSIQFFVQKLPHIGDEVPAKWVSIRDEIETIAKNNACITENEYFEIYGKHLEFDRDKARHLSQYLHDLGVFLHFQDKDLLQRIVILQNEWATAAVFRILDDMQTKVNLGRFTDADCERIWGDSQYADMHPELRALMENFELCYKLPDKEPTTWLAPQLLPASMPESLADWGQVGDLVLSYCYDFLPRGLVNRLMVRMHHFVKQPELAWTDGALFQHEDSQLLIKTTIRGDELVLRARGPQRKELMSVISSDLDTLNTTYGDLKKKVNKRVPCICPKCLNSSEPHLYEEKKLLNRKEKNKLTIECEESFEDVKVLELLDGLKLDKLPPWAEDPSKKSPEDQNKNGSMENRSPKSSSTASLKTIRIFLASSKELAEERDAFELYFRQQNDSFRDKGYYLEIIRWENSIESISETRMQDEYNKKIKASHLFVSLFSTKAGKYTVEEFEVAHQNFKENGKPKVYTYFKNSQVNMEDADREALNSFWAFKDKLIELEHFYSTYNDIEHLKLKFSDQLQKLMNEGLI